jgi:hypothetical protein
MKVQVTRQFKDSETKDIRRKGDVLEVKKERGDTLVKAGVAVEIDKNGKAAASESNEVATNLETPST